MTYFLCNAKVYTLYQEIFIVKKFLQWCKEIVGTKFFHIEYLTHPKFLLVVIQKKCLT